MEFSFFFVEKQTKTVEFLMSAIIDSSVSVSASLRVQFAVENQPVNQLHGSDSLEEAEREINFFFPQQRTLAVIKPDAVEEHKGHLPPQSLIFNNSTHAGSSFHTRLVLCDPLGQTLF